MRLYVDVDFLFISEKNEIVVVNLPKVSGFFWIKMSIEELS